MKPETRNPKLRHLGTFLLDLLYPRVCPVCGEASDREGRSVCWRCLSSLPLIDASVPRCRICGLVPDGCVDSDFVCDACLHERPAFDMARFAMRYEDDAKALVHTLKYHGGSWLSPDLCDILEGCARASFDVGAIDAIIPVPLSPARFRRRRYNQTELLARGLSSRLNVPASSRLVARTRNTPSQTHMTADERRRNVKGAFAVTEPSLVRARTLLVVDDVMTTGSTMSEIAAALKGAGAWRVWAIAIARADLDC